MGFFKQLTNETKEEIKYLYEIEKFTISEIANIFNVSTEVMRKSIHKLDIKVRTKSEALQKYNVDRNFFKVIDTEEKAYWLGFMYADGYTVRYPTKSMFGLKLSIADENHLIKFKQSIQAEHPIKYLDGHIITTEKKEYVSNKQVVLNIMRTEIANDLMHLGCIPNKSLILQYPTEEQVPYNMQCHMIRGYFDGDGSIPFFKTENRFKGIDIVGTDEFLNGIINFLQPQYHFTKNRKNSDKNTYIFRSTSNESILDFYNKCYKNATIYLDRKYIRFQDFFKLHNK